MISSCMVLLLGLKIFLILILLKVFQKELGKRTGTVQVLKRSGRELIENSRDDTTWVKGQLQELSTRWDTVCKLSVSKQSRLEQALKQVRDVWWENPRGFCLNRFILVSLSEPIPAHLKMNTTSNIGILNVL